MFTRLVQKYPNAITSFKPNDDPQYLWLKDTKHESYVGIPITSLTKEEISLLKTLFPFETTANDLTLPTITKEWQTFLFKNGQPPQIATDTFRFIHYSISDIRDEFQFSEWEEAIKSLFSADIIIVPFNANQGIIIEEKTNVSITEEELFSALQAFESDFFFKVYFFIGRFQIMDQLVKPLYYLEQTMLKLAASKHPEERIFTREKVMPLFIYYTIQEKDQDILFADVHRLLSDDLELSETIKTYIENQSNATLTAKQLFMHRNSLQYRIDKFIEKTGIDIKTFHGAFFVYLACIHLEEH